MCHTFVVVITNLGGRNVASFFFRCENGIFRPAAVCIIVFFQQGMLWGLAFFHLCFVPVSCLSASLPSYSEERRDMVRFHLIVVAWCCRRFLFMHGLPQCAARGGGGGGGTQFFAFVLLVFAPPPPPNPSGWIPAPDTLPHGLQGIPSPLPQMIRNVKPPTCVSNAPRYLCSNSYWHCWEVPEWRPDSPELSHWIVYKRLRAPPRQPGRPQDTKGGKRVSGVVGSLKGEGCLRGGGGRWGVWCGGWGGLVGVFMGFEALPLYDPPPQRHRIAAPPSDGGGGGGGGVPLGGGRVGSGSACSKRFSAGSRSELQIPAHAPTPQGPTK